MVRRRVEHEFIVTSYGDDLTQLLAEAGKGGQGYEKKRTIQLTHKGRNLSLGLIKAALSSADKTEDLFDKLKGNIRTRGLKVSLEPNCGVALPFRQSVNPWEWETSPWEWETSPWEWETSLAIPRVIPIGATPQEGEMKFRQQAAFRTIGLTDAAGERNPALSAYRGSGVVVGVFDTLPDHTVSAPWLTLHAATTAIEAPHSEPGRDLSDHGLLIASLIHAVAPEAEVHLYEVCGKDGNGSLFPLLTGLSEFITLAAGRPAVINLSLGSLCCGGSTSPALQALLQKATDLGMVVCAAAGNRAKSCVKACTLPQAQIPAGFPNVIAVSAANAAGHRSSFSQRGDIAAYGGEDIGDPGPGDPEDMVGMGDSPSGYVAMDGGTSFSTPLMVGAAALVLADHVATGGVLGATTYQTVFGVIKAATRQPAPATGETLENDGLGAGILDLTRLFNR